MVRIPFGVVRKQVQKEAFEWNDIAPPKQRTWLMESARAVCAVLLRKRLKGLCHEPYRSYIMAPLTSLICRSCSPEIRREPRSPAKKLQPQSNMTNTLVWKPTRNIR